MDLDTFCILATGPSMTQDQADYVRGKCRVIAISNAYQLAPWADALVSHDREWWRQHPDALNFVGGKYCKMDQAGTAKFAPYDMPIGCNSGLMGMYVARDYGAKKIILLGFDMHGTHYFGRHPEGLKNTTEIRFKQHMFQFRLFSGAEVINCTPDSALKRFPLAALSDTL